MEELCTFIYMEKLGTVSGKQQEKGNLSELFKIFTYVASNKIIKV